MAAFHSAFKTCSTSFNPVIQEEKPTLGTSILAVKLGIGSLGCSLVYHCQISSVCTSSRVSLGWRLKSASGIYHSVSRSENIVVITMLL